MVAPHPKRLAIIELHRAGHSTKDIANLLNVYARTVPRNGIGCGSSKKWSTGNCNYAKKRGSYPEEDPQKSKDVAEEDGKRAGNQPIECLKYSGWKTKAEEL
ncbi:unnamed protein product [Nippostrongylus brasiliensis]|uniref:HTH_38 domain-containing protein n=1 Tax=Nippostrongylus brasiliensis TaxID=27835 RepID=A0A0N4XVS9_NIPBR|nr:unnamed protein product [Nippostrongylus brasiliensis]